MRIETPEIQTYIESLIPAESASKLKSRTSAEELGLGRISLSPSEGQLLSFMVRQQACRKFVEIGTLTGLSAQYILEGMPADGQLWTLEKTEAHAAKAKEALAMHPAGARARIVVGDARVTLEALAAEGPFDGVFIDGNKAAYGDYLAWAEKNVRRGGLIVADNVFLSGAVWGATTVQKFSEKQIAVLQAFNKRLADASLYDSVVMPTSEGMTVAIKRT
jgi:predicted O-methyltransferase YrrM